MTSGSIIGNIFDNLAILKQIIIFRNKFGLFDLNRFVENFFKQVLNITYKINLTNLNTERHNYPGLDLGDPDSKIAYQVTTIKSSAKVNDTLSKITESDSKRFKTFYVLVVGEKESKYKIDQKLSESYSFTENNIIDLIDICKLIMDLDIDSLLKLDTLFKKEFLKIRSEIEIKDNDEIETSSYFNNIEKYFSCPAINFELYKEYFYLSNLSWSQNEINEIKELYIRLNNVPKITRELYLFLFRKSESGNVLYQKIKRFIHHPEFDPDDDLMILIDEGLVINYTDDSGENIPRVVISITNWDYLNTLYDFSEKMNLNIEDIIINLNFKLLDK